MEDYSNQDEYGYEDHEETKPTTVTSAAIKYGLYLGIVSVVIALVQYMFLSDNPSQRSSLIILVVSTAISATAIFFAQKEFKKGNEGYMSYGEGLGIGTLLSVISGVISSVFNVLYRTVIDPEFTKRSMEQSRKIFEDAGTMSDAEIEQAMGMAEKFSSPVIIFFVGIIFAAIGGLIISLIVSAINQNKRPMFD